MRSKKKLNCHSRGTFLVPLFLLAIFLGINYKVHALSEAKDTLRQTIPYSLPWDDMPIDLSFIYAKEKPAGKHGFLTVRGDKFFFEDGTEAKFWGTNFNSAQIFPSHEHSEMVAKRIAKIGINLVRFHQMDAEWSTPNLFQFDKGENKPNTMSFDPESIDRLDYLIHCLKKEGIYVYMDLLTYRRFKTGDGVEAADNLRDAAKPYSTFSRRLIELQKKFNYDLWTHINPYTGLAYKDDPAIVLAEITNENDLWTQGATLEPYRSELESMYRKWAEQKGEKIPSGKVDFTKVDRTMNDFFIDVNKDYYTEMILSMRDAGVKIPIAGTNWSIGSGHLCSQMAGDFIDTHGYWRGGGRRGADGRFGNMVMTGSLNNILPVFTFNRAQGKPFFISEWDNSWPSEWRAEGSLLMAAAGSFQGWGGFAIHTYRYTLEENVDMIGKPITGDAIGGVSYRAGVFDTFNDPAKMGLFYHAALIFRRGDVKPANKTLSLKLPDRYLPIFRRGESGPADRSLEVNLDDLATAKGIEGLQLSTEQHRVEIVLPETKPNGDIIAEISEKAVDVEKGEVMSDTKELYRNLNKQIGWIDTPKTKVVYGFLGKEGYIPLTGLKINVKTDFATVAVSSLSNEPISNSDNMLLTAVGRADNTDSKYNEEHNHQLDVGHGPIQAEIINAVVEINTDKKNLRVMSVNPQGLITGYIPSSYENGVFKFEIGNEFQSIYYLIQSL